jgi:putative hemolysin
MFSSILAELAIIVVLILANGLFAAAEIAVVSARRGRMEQQAQLGRRGAIEALELMKNPNRFLSTVQVGITVISTLAAVFGGASLTAALEASIGAVPTLAPYATSIALSAVVLLISYLSLILGELVPKRLALQNAEGMASAVAPLMRRLSRAASPVVGFLTASTELILRLLGKHNLAESPITEDDIIALVREGAADGTVEAAERELITNVFTFTDRTLRSLMTPRTQITAIAVDMPFSEALRTIAEAGYSRLPVYQDSLDQIVGILYVKDLLPSWGQSKSIDLRSLIRPPLYMLESQRAIIAFQRLQEQRSGMAIVVDEYGQVDGLITLEDLLEEVFGDIADEYDQTSESIVRRDDGSYLVDGLLSFADLRARLSIPAADLPEEQEFETVAGFLLALLGHIPTPGEQARWQGYRFEVIDMDGHRIDKVLLQPPPPTASQQTQAALASGAALPPTSGTQGEADDAAAKERGRS